MQIREMFAEDINRSINGVIKVCLLYTSSVSMGTSRRSRGSFLNASSQISLTVTPQYHGNVSSTKTLLRVSSLRRQRSTTAESIKS